MNYEINIETLALIPINDSKTKILEKDKEMIVNLNFLDIINNSCKFFGSSLQGRLEGSKSIMGTNNYKLPIIIEESNKIIFFPLASARSNNCIWLSLNNILRHQKYNNLSKITFTNNKSLEIHISYGSLDNQILRATRLESIITKRQEKY